MTLIDRALQGASPEVAQSLTVPDAIAAVMVAAVASDGALSPEEAARMNNLMATSRVLGQGADGSTQRLAERAVGLLSDNGLPAVLTACAKVIPTDLRATTFALATDLVLADGRIGDREKSFIDELQVVLQIDDSTALKIVDVMLIKNRG